MNFRVVQLAIIVLASFIFINNISALDIPTAPEVTETVSETVETVSEDTSTSTSSGSSTTPEVTETVSETVETVSEDTSANTTSTSSSGSSSTTPEVTETVSETVETVSEDTSTSTSSGSSSTTSTSTTGASPNAISTSMPKLPTSTLGEWTTPFSATVVNGNTTDAVNSIDQLPQIITTESSSALDAAINSQSSILLDISFPPLTSGSTIINTIGLPNYAMPEIESGVAVIPTIVADTDAMSGQVVVIPLGKIISGQEMIISVADSLIPSYGGLKEINLQPSSSAVPTGNPAPEEWMTAEVDNKIPSSIPSSGLDGTPILFLNIQYPFEQSGTGFNWGDPATFAKPPTLTLVVYKTDLDYIQKDSVGCPLVDAYTLSSGSWTSNGLGQISSESVSSTKCHIKIQTQHFSKFAFSLRHIGSIQSSGPGTFGLGAVTTDAKLNLLVIPDKAKTSSLATIQTTSVKTEQLRTISDPTEGFGNLVCSRGFGYALMVGEYTGGSIPYSLVSLKMTLLDSAGRILGTGSGSISDVDAHKTKLFNALTRYDKEFDSCSIQIKVAVEK